MILWNFFVICWFLSSNVFPSRTLFNESFVSLPDEHLPRYFTAFPDMAKKCERSKKCPHKKHLNTNKCWGYERNCDPKNSYSIPSCPGDHRGWVQTKQAQFDTFYTQADFGYVKDRLSEMMIICEPYFLHDSSLECTKHFRFCRGRNLMFNFTDLVKRGDNLRYKMDILNEGQIGGYCRLNDDRKVQDSEHMSPLQSWAPEMSKFASLHSRPISSETCDIVIEKPTYIMKIDATVNMYHHFCDFFNLYISLHVNSVLPTAFSKDNHILIWETYTYDSAFKDTWKAFTDNPIWDLKTFRGEIVCFKNAIFPLLPRMIFGLYYNTPVIHGCEKSGLFHAFSKHILNGLKINLHKRENKKVRITLLSRETKYRNILNEAELIDALNNSDQYEIKRVVYNRNVPFTEQLSITHNTDIFIGIHGAGLTHLLFLPDWAVVFELYNCEDGACYSDLARLRGIKYITWESHPLLFQQDNGHHPEGGSHPKFTNFAFDVDEFMRLVHIGVDHVKSHEAFINFTRSETETETENENETEINTKTETESEESTETEINIEIKTETKTKTETETKTKTETETKTKIETENVHQEL